MKTGRSLTDLAQEIERRATVQQDFVAQTGVLGFDRHGDEENPRWAIEVPTQGYFAVTDHTHRQVSAHTQVPWRYYQRMMDEAPHLLRENVRHWFDANDKRRMVRTLDGNARAFLSDRYKRLDNLAVMENALPALLDRQDAAVLSCDVTDNRLYVKVLFRDIEAEVKPGDTIRPGVMVRNSEIGGGKLEVSAFFYRDFCWNGCVFGMEQAFEFSRTHLGGRVIESTDYQVLSDETVEAQDRALLGEVADCIRASADPAMFAKTVEVLRASAETSRIENPEPAVQVLANELGLTDGERSQVLVNLIQDQDYSQWGALNAVTKVANETESYDRASELEEVGARVLGFSPSLWDSIVKAEKVPVAA